MAPLSVSSEVVLVIAVFVSHEPPEVVGLAGSVDEDGQASVGPAVEIVVQYGGEWSRARGRGI